MYVIIVMFIIGVPLLLSTAIMGQSKQLYNSSILHCIFLWFGDV